MVRPDARTILIIKGCGSISFLLLSDQGSEGVPASFVAGYTYMQLRM